MKTNRLLILASLFVLTSTVFGQTVTGRLDLTQDKKPTYASYIQGLEGLGEIWVHNCKSHTPLVRVGAIGTLNRTVRAGGYLDFQAKAISVNPRLILCGGFMGGKGLFVVDGYLPVKGKMPLKFGLSEANLVFPVCSNLSIGPALNGEWAEGKKPMLWGAIASKVRLSKSDSVFLRWNLWRIQGNQRSTQPSVRLEYSHSF